MRRASRARAKVIAVVALIGLMATACGGDADESDSAAGESLSGKITIDGSSTVEPLSTAIAEEFRKEQGDVDISVGTSGTGGGFEKFCAGEIDIADASRPIKDEEVAACKAGGVEYTEFRVGLDGLAVVTSADNKFLECLSTDQMATIFKTGGAKTWNEVDPKFPSEDLAIFAPGTDSGTYDFFVEEILGAEDEPGSLKPRTDYTASEDDNTLVQGIEGEENSWGFFGFAYFKENSDKLKAISVQNDDGECVEPSDETVETGDYPLSRPLFIYVKNSELAREEVREFVRFYLDTTPELITDVGYTAAPEKDYADGLAKLDAG